MRSGLDPVAEVLRATHPYVERTTDADCASTDDVDSAGDARRRFEAVLREVECGRGHDAARALFLPTSWLQDVSIAAGWGDDFLELAARLDTATG